MPKYEFVAVDFDGTLCTNAFPEIGEPNPVVIGYVRKLAEEGSKIILYTSRENGTRKLLDEAVAFCKAQEIPIHAVNENPWNPYAATIALYAALTVAGIMLFRAGAAVAYAERGYNAVGGEVFALLLPAFYYIISQAVGDIVADMKKHQGGKDHEKTC